ncbi:MAG: HigA family addiction module antidote protein [Thioalkalivibrio sp.]|nr:HigA family addiction module antidote protein [Thioalkalivibrio sp.]
MTTSATVMSDLAVAPGDYLQEVLEELGMSQADLARRLGRPVQAVNEIVKGTKAITPATALQLEQVLPVGAHIWTGLEEAYRLAIARKGEKVQLDAELELVDTAVYRKLAEFGAVPDVSGRSSESQRQRVRAMRKFFGVASLHNVPNVQSFRAAFCVSTKGRVEEYAIAAWLCWGEREAKKQTNLGNYDPKAVRSLIPWLRRMSLEHESEWQQAVSQALAHCGVALVVLPHLPKTRAHGATYWLPSGEAVIQLSLRHKRADIFWFSFFHEIGHLLRHRKRTVYVSWDPEGAEYTDVQEREADEFAGEVLIPPPAFEDFVGRMDFSHDAIVAFAAEIEIHPSIVLGRLQKLGNVSPKTLNGLHVYLDPQTD